MTRCAGADIGAEPELGVAVLLGKVSPQRLGQIRLSAGEVALGEVCEAAASVVRLSFTASRRKLSAVSR